MPGQDGTGGLMAPVGVTASGPAEKQPVAHDRQTSGHHEGGDLFEALDHRGGGAWLLSLNRRRPPRVWSRIGSGRPLPSVATAICRQFRRPPFPSVRPLPSFARWGGRWLRGALAGCCHRTRSVPGRGVAAEARWWRTPLGRWLKSPSSDRRHRRPFFPPRAATRPHQQDLSHR